MKMHISGKLDTVNRADCACGSKMQCRPFWMEQACLDVRIAINIPSTAPLSQTVHVTHVYYCYYGNHIYTEFSAGLSLLTLRQWGKRRGSACSSAGTRTHAAVGVPLFGPQPTFGARLSQKVSVPSDIFRAPSHRQMSNSQRVIPVRVYANLCRFNAGAIDVAFLSTRRGGARHSGVPGREHVASQSVVPGGPAV